MAEVVRQSKVTKEQALELVRALRETHDACNYFEGRVYSLTHERDRLKAENEFLCRLISVKLEG